MTNLRSRGVIFALAATLGIAAFPASAASPAAGAKLTLWGWTGATMASSFDAAGNDVLAQQAKEDLGIDLEVSVVEQNELGAKLKAALPAGNGPDLLATDFDVMGPYWGFMEPLDAMASQEWGPEWRSNFGTAALSELDLVSEIAGAVGTPLYMPGNMQLLWPMYSQKLFADAGLDATAIKTYDDLINACETLRQANILPMAIGSHPAGLVDLYQFLVEVAAPDRIELAERGQAKFTDPDLARTFELIAEVFNTCADTGAIGADIGTVTFPSFYTNQAAMMMQFPGTPLMSDVHSPDPMTQDLFNNDFATFPFPESEGLAGTDGGIGILADSENKDAAWQVVKWLVSGKQAERIIAYGQPVAWEALRPAPLGTPYDQNLGEPLYGALANGDNKFRRILCPDVYSTLTSVIPAVVIGQIDAARAAQETQDAFDRGCQNWVQP